MSSPKFAFLSEESVGSKKLFMPNEPTRFTRQDVHGFFIWATETGASDITIKTGDKIWLEIDGRMHPVTRHALDHSEVMEIVVGMYGSESAKSSLAGKTPLDFPYQVRKDRDTRYRFRVDAVGITVDGTLGAEITARTIASSPPPLEALNLEPEIMENIAPSQGMVVVTGGTGSGKSTLLSSIIGHLVQQPEGHRKIITFEAPIEYVYDELPHPTTSISQTQVGTSLENFVEGTRNALRRKPTIILLGEARDAETIGEAITASMTGHLLYTTIHSNGFADTIRRMVNVFEGEKNARATDIVSSLRMVISQRLVPDTRGKRVALREFVVMNDDIVDFILDGGVDNMTASCREVLRLHGQSFAQDARKKFEEGRISEATLKMFIRQEKARERDQRSDQKSTSATDDLVRLLAQALSPSSNNPAPSSSSVVDDKKVEKTSLPPGEKNSPPEKKKPSTRKNDPRHESVEKATEDAPKNTSGKKPETKKPTPATKDVKEPQVGKKDLGHAMGWEDDDLDDELEGLDSLDLDSGK